MMARPKRMRTLTIPNLLTLGNLLSGGTSVALALRGSYASASLLLLLSVLFDVLDGWSARRLSQESDLGEHLDSLADLVSFGVAPAVLSLLTGGPIVLSLLFLAAGAYRLARFSVLKAGGMKGFLGMPITANGIVVPVLMLLGLAWLLPWWLLLSSALMAAPIRLPGSH